MTARSPGHLTRLGLLVAVAASTQTVGAAPGATAAAVPEAVSGSVLAGAWKPTITGGAPDGKAHPYVAMIVLPGASRPSCTGVAVSADNGVAVVLTDAHCLFHGQYSGTRVGVTFAADFSPTAPRLSGRFAIDPRYSASTHLHDVAVITLTSRAPASPARLPTLGAAAGTVGTYLDTVGTGRPYPGHRRSATELVTRTSADWLYLRARTGNSCDGDSGGPDLQHASSTVLALTDQGSCSYDQDTRLDITTGSRSFLDRTAGLSRARPTIQYGSTGTDVRVVQNLLGATTDSSFGPQTQTAVVTWQRRHNLTADGVVGPLTWTSLGY